MENRDFVGQDKEESKREPETFTINTMNGQPPAMRIEHVQNNVYPPY